MSNSADVNAGDDALASQYNNLRADVLNISTGHTHNGTDSKLALAYGFYVKKLTGTTSNSEGGYVDILTGVAVSKIISIMVLVDLGNPIPANWTESAGYQFYWHLVTGNVRVTNHATNSEHILSAPIRIGIIYEP